MTQSSSFFLDYLNASHKNGLSEFFCVRESMSVHWAAYASDAAHSVTVQLSRVCRIFTAAVMTFSNVPSVTLTFVHDETSHEYHEGLLKAFARSCEILTLIVSLDEHWHVNGLKKGLQVHLGKRQMA